MKTLSKIAFAPAALGAMALTLAAAGPVEAQSRDRDNNNNSDATKNALIGAAVGGLAGALFGNGDGTYIAGGALAGAALGAASSSNDDDCGYRRGGQCYRNQGHWEREHGINSRDYRYGYSYDRNDRRDNRRNDRDYRYDRRW